MQNAKHLLKPVFDELPHIVLWDPMFDEFDPINSLITFSGGGQGKSNLFENRKNSPIFAPKKFEKKLHDTT